jgi:hypothetical protein
MQAAPASSSVRHRGTLPRMSESAPTPIELPEKTPEQLAEIHELIEQVRQGDYSKTVSWDELAAELGL